MSTYFQIWKAIQIRLLGIDAVESEGAFPPTAKLQHTDPTQVPASGNGSACSLGAVHLPRGKWGPLICDWSSQPFSLWPWLSGRWEFMPTSSLLLPRLEPYPAFSPCVECGAGLLGRVSPPWGSRPESASPFPSGVSLGSHNVLPLFKALRMIIQEYHASSEQTKWHSGPVAMLHCSLAMFLNQITLMCV